MKNLARPSPNSPELHFPRCMQHGQRPISPSKQGLSARQALNYISQNTRRASHWLSRGPVHAQTYRRGGRGREKAASWRRCPETGGGWTPAGAREMKSPGRSGGQARRRGPARVLRFLDNGSSLVPYSARAALARSEVGSHWDARGWGRPARPGSAPLV